MLQEVECSEVGSAVTWVDYIKVQVHSETGCKIVTSTWTLKRYCGLDMAMWLCLV